MSLDREARAREVLAAACEAYELDSYAVHVRGMKTPGSQWPWIGPAILAMSVYADECPAERATLTTPAGEGDGGEAITAAARRMVAIQGMDWAELDGGDIGYWESLAAEALATPSPQPEGAAEAGERARMLKAQVQDALRPFAQCALDGAWSDGAAVMIRQPDQVHGLPLLQVRDFRRARDVFTSIGPEPFGNIGERRTYTNPLLPAGDLTTRLEAVRQKALAEGLAPNVPYDWLVEALEGLRALRRVRRWLTPSELTKCDFSGEFSWTVWQPDEEGREQAIERVVPWTVVKEIMELIRERAGVERLREGDEEDARNG